MKDKWDTAKRSELIEFLSDDYRVDLNGREYILRLIDIGKSGSEGSRQSLEQGICVPAVLPEFRNVRRSHLRKTA